MSLLLAVALGASLGAQESPEGAPEALVARFVAGDDGAAEKIRALGPAVLSLLGSHRKDPRVRDLRRLIRGAAASAEDRTLGKRLSSLKVVASEGFSAFGYAADNLMGDGVRCVIDPLEFEAIAGAQVSIPPEGSALDDLEEICAQAGTDFAFRYGIVLVAHPDRLWPRLPSRREPLSPEERARARALVSRLGSEVPEERDGAAAELRKLGPPIVGVLESGTEDPDAEVAERCRGLVRELSPRVRRILGPPAAELQRLSADDQELWESLTENGITIRAQEIDLRVALGMALSRLHQDGTAGQIPERKFTVSFDCIPEAAVLSVLTQSAGLDFMVEEGRVLIGPAEEIRRRARK